jgi:hypothetical protein
LVFEVFLNRFCFASLDPRADKKHITLFDLKKKRVEVELGLY